ncbi:aldo/keto reductase [Kribbella deserti]|uniref:Aldo/keto reductase n=1 Tax=Kribbella deserti TaxID=1926257 RepID=A0ABV6QGB6_9ACTN
MDTVTLGRSGLQVTRLGLGLASIGGMFSAVSTEQAIATIDRAWELGIRLFDTAPVYGYGRSEQRTGVALGNKARDEFVLCSKVGRLIEPNGPDLQPSWADPPPGVGPRLDYSYAGVMRSVTESLERLGLDRIDVLHIHDPELDFERSSTEAFKALAQLRSEGTIRAVSLGVNHADVAVRFLRLHGLDGPDLVLLAGRYSLLDQSGADELLPRCENLGVSVLAAGVFQGGVLLDPSPGAPHGYREVPHALSTRIADLRRLCDLYDVPLPAAAMQFPLNHPAVPAILVGARSPEEITETTALLDHPIPPDFWHSLPAL